MSRFVVLYHEAGPGLGRPDHYDWLFLPPAVPFEGDPDESVLWCWASPSLPAPGSFSVTRLPDHRRRYLDFEGPLSDQRGAVRRVLEGKLTWFDSEPPVLQGELRGVETWRFSIRSEPNSVETFDLWVPTTDDRH